MLAANTLLFALFFFCFAFGLGQQIRSNVCGSMANSGPPGNSGELKCFTTGFKTESLLCNNGQWIPQGACKVGHTVEAYFPEHQGKILADCPAHKPVCKGTYHTHAKTCSGECTVEQRGLFGDIMKGVNQGVHIGGQIAGMFGR